jgi:hypothetical protein
MGTILAATWYIDQYPDALIASLDTERALQWLHGRPGGQERADLVGLRFEQGTLVVEPIEVKTKANIYADLHKNNNGQVEGKAVRQLQALTDTLSSIFSLSDFHPLFTPARREVLKYQLYRECFRDQHRDIQGFDWQQSWYEILQKAFSVPKPAVSVKLSSLAMHIDLEGANENEEARQEFREQSLKWVTLGPKSIQKLIEDPDEHVSQPASTQGEGF